MGGARWHGTAGGYSNHKCRCDECRLAWNNYLSSWKRKKRASYVHDSQHEHGQEKTYQRGCTCSACRKSHSEYSKLIRNGERAKNGVCDICQASGVVSWDHDHATDLHRGWLCINCNQGLGLFQDSVRTLLKAREYLETVKGV